MFWVRDTRAERYSRIRSFLTKEDAAIAVLLAAANLEWTFRRAILLLTKSARTAVRAKLERCHGLAGYRAAWEEEVTPHFRTTLSAVVENWKDLVGKKGMFQSRHDLIHGSVGACGIGYAKTRVEALLAAASDVDKFCAEHDRDLYAKLPIPRE